jgi:type IV secretion system protein VirB2
MISPDAAAFGDRHVFSMPLAVRRQTTYWQGRLSRALSGPDFDSKLAGNRGTIDVELRRCGRGVAAAAAMWSAECLAQDSYSGADPQGSGVVVSAVRWLQGTLLGTVATVVAVIAVASVGFLMLTGRINWRYGATVILGCFILFGAASIVAGIQSTAGLGG